MTTWYSYLLATRVLATRYVHTADRHDRLPADSNLLSLTSGKSALIRDIFAVLPDINLAL
jgi:hypothetical protein